MDVKSSNEQLIEESLTKYNSKLTTIEDQIRKQHLKSASLDSHQTEIDSFLTSVS